MTEEPRAPEDTTGVGDNAEVNQPNPNLSRTSDGEVVFAEGVSGPDPRFWGEDVERPDPFVSEQVAEEGAGGTPPDTIREDGTAGPDSRWWTKEVDENGVEQYVGRDDLNYLQPPPEVTDLRTQDVIQAAEASVREVDEAVTVAEQETEEGVNSA